MKENEKKIALVTLKLLKIKSWKNLKLEEIKSSSKINSFDKIITNKQDILRILNNFFDYKFKLASTNIEISNRKDMIFEIIMMRFDIIQNYRHEVLSIFNSFKKKPKDLLLLLPSLLDSIILMLKYAKISTSGLKGAVKIKGIFIIYISTFFVWIKDETPSIEKTMTSLDNYLDNAGKILQFIKLK